MTTTYDLPDPVVVVVIRDPDDSNDINVYGADATIIDVDLGRADLSDPDEFAEWAEAMDTHIKTLPAQHPAAALIADTVGNIAERYDHDLDAFDLGVFDSEGDQP